MIKIATKIKFSNTKLKLALFVLLFIFLITAGSRVLADGARPLEIQYPTIPRATTPASVETPLPEYVKYIYYFFIVVAGSAALFVLIRAGFTYLISAGRPEMMKDAKDQIFSALAGLLILFSSWIILNSLNPQLLNFQIKKLSATIPSLSGGVYLCKQKDDGTERVDEVTWAWEKIRSIKGMDPNSSGRESAIQQVNEWLKEVEKYCWLVPNSGEIDEKVNKKVKMAYIIPSETNTLYGAVLYKESKFGGKSQVVYVLEAKATPFEAKNNPASIRTFTLKKPAAESYAEISELIDFNKADPQKKSEKNTASDLASSYIDISGFTDNKIGSIKIEGDLIVIFFKEEQSGDWSADAVLDVFVQTDANLYDNLMGLWCHKTVFLLPSYYPCPKQMVIVSGGIY